MHLYPAVYLIVFPELVQECTLCNLFRVKFQRKKVICLDVLDRYSVCIYIRLKEQAAFCIRIFHLDPQLLYDFLVNFVHV